MKAPDQITQTLRRKAPSLLLRASACVMATFTLLGQTGVQATAQGAFTVYDVEAAYLYNFGRFVHWPGDPSPAQSFNICVLGEERLNHNLDAVVAGVSIQGEPAAARHIRSVAESEGCRILYLGPGEAAHLQADLAALQKKPMLTVSDQTGFLELGGMVQFVMQQYKVRFAVNLTPAQDAGLTFSSELLKVAKQVRGSLAQGARP